MQTASDPVPQSETPTVPPRRRSRHIWAYVLGVFVVAIVAVVALWDWDWFIPMVDARATAALGRKTTIQHLDVKLGRTTTVIASGVQVANPDGLGDGKPFADIAKLTVAADVMAYYHTRQIVIPQIIVDQPVVEADQDASGRASWTGLGGSSSSSSESKDPAAGPRIGQLVINGGKVHALLAKLKADFDLDVATRSSDDVQGAQHDKAAANGGQIVVDAKGKYANQPITGQLVAGALLSLRDASNPYPIDLHLANGPTHVALTGTVENPLNFAGANLKLEFSGPNAALLMPLTGIPIPETPPYSIAGALDYADHKIRFTHFTGRLGSSDLNGDILVDPGHERPVVDANLYSRQVDLKDLAGFIGGTPGHAGERGTAPAQQAEQARATASDKLLPNTPINLPKLTTADVKLRYKGEHILGRSIPLDNIVANVDITDGRIVAKPISFAVGSGEIAINTDLDPVSAHAFKTKTDIEFKRLDVAKLLAATGAVQGAGTVSGSANIDATGDSMATLLGHGNGGLRVGMGGGNLSALLVDLAGLEFGNAVLSALGIPNRAQIQCFALNFALNHGTLDTRTFLLDTSEARVTGTGTINLSTEAIDYKLTTDSKHFSIGTFKTPIDIKGTLKKPAIAPEIGPLAARAGAAVGLGVLFPPAALLPTIQFGTGDDNACQAAEAPIAHQVNAAAGKREMPEATGKHRAAHRRVEHPRRYARGAAGRE
jgi:uncharacterized protein involved in outer membrane biogenesis